MKQTFWTSNSNAKEIQGLLKKYKTIRFRANPIIIGDRIEFCLGGDVEEFNQFNQDVDLIEEKLKEIDKKPLGFFGQLKNWLKNDFIS
jgi:hypothetical protein